MNKKKLAVFGNPIAHSKSPIIHREFARQCGIDLDYQTILVDGDIKSAIDNFRAEGGDGGNITLPFKEQAFATAGLAHSPALIAKAANTFWWGEDETLIVTNTDGIGLVQDIIVNCQFEINNKKILILGAGGASCGIIAPLMLKSPTLIHIANRTIARAQNLVKNFVGFDYADYGVKEFCAINTNSLTENPIYNYDLIINATSAGIVGNDFFELSKKLCHSKTLAYDLIYGRETPFSIWTKSNDIQYVDGLGMLVEQAAEAFFLWQNLRPQTAPIINMLRKK